MLNLRNIPEINPGFLVYINHFHYICTRNQLKLTVMGNKKSGYNDANLMESRYNGLVDQIDFYLWIYNDNKCLSKEQQKHCIELRNTIQVFGQRAKKWVAVINELLS
jgi:hypothetical protein